MDPGETYGLSSSGGQGLAQLGEKAQRLGGQKYEEAMLIIIKI